MKFSEYINENIENPNVKFIKEQFREFGFDNTYVYITKNGYKKVGDFPLKPTINGTQPLEFNFKQNDKGKLSLTVHINQFIENAENFDFSSYEQWLNKIKFIVGEINEFKPNELMM